MTQSTFSAQVANKYLTILQGYSKTIRLLLVMFLTLTASAEVWGATTDEISSFTATSGQFGNVSYAAYKGGGTSNPAVNSNAIRLYQNSNGNTAGYIVLSVPDGYKITSATIKSTMKTTTGYYIASNPGATTPNKNSFEVSNYSLAANTPYTVSGLSTQHITFACFGTSSSTRLYLSYLAVTYETSGGGSTPDPCTTPTVAWNTKPANGEVGGSMTASVTTNYSNGLTYSSSDQTVATVTNAGFINYLSAGTTTITATVTGDGTTFCEGPVSVQQEITVTAPAGGGGDDDADTWTLVKNVNDLAAGDQVVIAASSDNYALSTTQNSNNRGRAAVTKNGETITFGNDVQVLTLQTGNVNGTLAFYTGNGYLHAASSSSNYLRTETTLSNNSSWTITITNTGIATIKAQGTYSKNWLRYNSSSLIFSCYSSGQGDVSIYKKGGSGGGGSTPDPDPIPVTSVSLDKTSHTMNEGETVTLTATVLPANADDPSVSWKSDNEAVAKVNTNGGVTAVSPGNATITVTTTDGELTATCTITVNALPTVEGTWTLVTNAANLKAGDRIVIAAAEYDFALSTTQNTNNRGQAAVTKNGNNIIFTEATQIITLEAGTIDNTLAFNTGSGYLCAASSSSNYLRTQATNNDNGSWNISIDNAGIATVVAQGENTNNTLFYNQSSKLFSCYANTASQKAIAIYKEGGGATTYTITSTLSHVTANGENPTTITSEAEDLTLLYSAESGWNLPATISVTMGGNQLMLNDEYTWDKETGKVWIVPANGFTGNIVVTINGWQQLATPTGLNVTNITSSSATLSWSQVANASSYTVFITDLDDEEITLTDIETTSVDVTRLSSETLYLWDVVAIGDGINYTDSEHSSQEDPNAEFTTPAAAAATAGYTIIHSRQALDDSYPESLIVKTTGTADVGSTITAEKKTYTGFVCNDAVQTITIQADAAQNVVTYKYVRQSYTLTWDLDGGNIIAEGTPAGTVKYGAPLTAPIVEKAGYRFDHWNPNVPATMQDGNCTYKAFYTQQHTVKWVSQGTVIRTDTYDTGAALEAAPTTGIIACDGKTHVGWTAQGGYANTTAPADLFTESSGIVTADATYYAVYAEGSGGGGTGWTAVTSISDLEAGATYAISNAATGGTYLSTWDGGNNFPGSISIICPLILGGSAGAWTFQIADDGTYNNQYLTATNTTTKNYLKAVTTADAYSVFTISFDATNKNAVITCTGKASRNILRYNANNGSPIFACYTSGQSDVYLQKQTSGGGYTDYSTSCGTYTVTFYGFNRGGCTTTCGENPAEIEVAQGATYTIPNCLPNDPAGLGRTFAGTWNTQVDGQGSQYKPGDGFTVDSDITLYAQWILKTTEDIVLPTDVEDLATTDIVVTGGTTLILEEGATTINSLTLKGGLQENDDYLMPAIYSDGEASVELNNKTIPFDLSVDKAHYYPFAVPFPVAVSDVDYADPTLASASVYGTHYVIKRYDGKMRADKGENKDANWVKVAENETLQPGIGYIITAVPIGGEALIRFPMSPEQLWLSEGKTVDVEAHTGAAAQQHSRHAGWNFIANPYLSRFAGVNVGNENNLLNGVLNYVNGEWQTTGEVPYVTIPAPDFTYYEQVELDDAILSPSYAFFVQAAKTAALSFATIGRQQNMPALRAASKGPLRMPLTISQSTQSDRTTLLVSDDYTTAYEIGKDLEKMFGSAEQVSLYAWSSNTPLAFCATPWSSAVQSIPLGYRTNKSGSVTIALDASADMSDAEMVLLYDAVTGMTTNLLLTDYVFETETGTFDARFTITITPKQGTTTDCEEVMLPTDGTYKFIENGQLYINHKGVVYTVEGKENSHVR